MANLLPAEFQKKTWGAERSRFLIVGSLVAITAAVMCALALAPAAVVLSFAAPSLERNAEEALISPAVQKADSITLQEAQTFLLLRPALTYAASSSEAIEQAIFDRPKGILVDHINYQSGSPSTLIISGASAGRETLNAYRRALEDDQNFSSVSVPVSDLVGSGGRFTVTLKGTF